METKTHNCTSKKNLYHLAYWGGSWVATMAIASYGRNHLWENNSGLTILFIAINAVVGIGMILMNRKYLNALDEMQRKVNLDAMAIALGVAVVGGLSYSMLDLANIIPFEAEIAHLVMLIGITYLIGVFIGLNRYR